MPVVKEIIHQYEINPLACGQAVISMLTGENVEKVISLAGTDRELTLKDVKFLLDEFRVSYDVERKQAEKITDLPDIAILSLETPKCWHWSLYFKGKVYDPEHGVLSDFPVSNRKYYWKITGGEDNS